MENNFPQCICKLSYACGFLCTGFHRAKLTIKVINEEALTLFSNNIWCHKSNYKDHKIGGPAERQAT